MKKFIVITFIVLGAFLFTTGLSLAQGNFAGGSGTEGDPFLIETAEQLDMVRNNLDGHFKLINDINLSAYSDGQGWEVIGGEEDQFTGVFDGQGYEITGLTINNPESGIIGLFASLAEDSLVKNINLTEVNVTGGERYCGGLAGINRGEIRDSYIQGTVTGVEAVGGMIGGNIGIIENSNSEVEVTGTGSVIGGLVGRNENKIIASSARGEVKGGTHAGGLVGAQGLPGGAQDLQEEAEIIESNAKVDVEGINYVGGLIGFSMDDSLIKNSHATGDVRGEKENIDNLIGMNHYETTEIIDSYGEGEVLRTDLKQTRVITTFSEHNGAVRAVDISSDDSIIVSGAENQLDTGESAVIVSEEQKTLKMWDLESGEVIHHFEEGDSINTAAFSNDDSLIASGSQERSSIRFWDPDTGERDSSKSISHSLGSQIQSLQFSDDDSLIVSSCSMGEVFVHEVDSESRVTRFSPRDDDDRVTAVDISPDKSMIASASYFARNDRIHINYLDPDDIGSDGTVRSLRGHYSGVNSVEFSSDNEMLLSASRDESVRIWDIESGEVLENLWGHNGNVSVATFSPDDSMIASGGSEGTVLIWDTETGEIIAEFTEHEDGVTDIVFSSDGSTVVSASSDETVKVWTLE